MAIVREYCHKIFLRKRNNSSKVTPVDKLKEFIEIHDKTKTNQSSLSFNIEDNTSSKLPKYAKMHASESLDTSEQGESFLKMKEKEINDLKPLDSAHIVLHVEYTEAEIKLN